MKKYCLCIALSFAALTSSFAEIKNGYAAGISSAYMSLKVFKSMLQDDHGLTPAKRKAIETKLKEMVKYITYYELTENLLGQLKVISPDLFYEIDTISDRQGRRTDVYVKFISEDEAPVQAWGLTGISQVAGDEDAYLSEYGERTVSIKVWVVDKALLVLSHELGHVRYVVPNISSYVNYHVSNYRPGSTVPNHVGHNPNDLSGKSAAAFEKRFKESYYSFYLKSGRARTDSPLALLNKIRKDILAKMLDTSPLARL
jgi:hypothetical protein